MKTFHHLRAGVIGTGFIGPVHIEALKRLGVQVSASGATAKEALTTGDKCEVSWSNVDAVHIPSPNKVYADQSFAATLDGKHVMCEKPLALNSPKTTKAGGALNSICLFFPAILQARTLITPEILSGVFRPRCRRLLAGFACVLFGIPHARAASPEAWWEQFEHAPGILTALVALLITIVLIVLIRRGIHVRYENKNTRRELEFHTGKDSP